MVNKPIVNIALDIIALSREISKKNQLNVYLYNTPFFKNGINTPIISCGTVTICGPFPMVRQKKGP